jgi:hypothetical protein
MIQSFVQGAAYLLKFKLKNYSTSVDQEEDSVQIFYDRLFEKLLSCKKIRQFTSISPGQFS